MTPSVPRAFPAIRTAGACALALGLATLMFPAPGSADDKYATAA
jgi:hypothetical protein